MWFSPERAADRSRDSLQEIRGKPRDLRCAMSVPRHYRPDLRQSWKHHPRPTYTALPSLAGEQNHFLLGRKSTRLGNL